MWNYLSAPLAFQARILSDLTVPTVHQFLQPIDLFGFVHVDLEWELRTVTSLRPRVGPKELLLRLVHVIGGEAARDEGVVEEPGEEECAHHEKQGSDLVRASAQWLVVVVGHWSRFVARSRH